MSLRNEYDEDFEGSSPSPRRSDRQGFTSEELKLRLYQTVKKKGIYDSLKVTDSYFSNNINQYLFNNHFFFIVST